MHRLDRRQVREILHDYKRECYLLEHNAHKHTEHEVVEREKQRIVDEILELNFHYEFKKPPNPERIEVLTMIESYVREAVLPPVVDNLVERVVVLQKRQQAGVRCLERLIEMMEEPEPARPD